MKPRIARPALAALLAISPVHADQTCSEQVFRSLDLRLPSIISGVDPRQLSCLGATEVLFIVEENEIVNRFELRQRVLSVLRKEGLIR